MSSHNTIQQLQESQNEQGRIFLLNAGVPTASVSGYSKGALAIDTTNGKLYINTGTSTSATWTVVGAQTA
jgi:predicted phosphodiesterase